MMFESLPGMTAEETTAFLADVRQHAPVGAFHLIVCTDLDNCDSGDHGPDGVEEHSLRQCVLYRPGCWAHLRNIAMDFLDQHPLA